MAPPVRTPRRRWIDAGLEALAASGPDGVRIDGLARTLGVTRGGFYWQFAGRAELLTALLDAWEHRTTDEVIEAVQREGGTPRERIARAGALTFPGRLRGVELAVREWARRDPEVADRLRRVDNRRMEFLRAEFRQIVADEGEVEARSLLAFSLVIGDRFIVADHGPHTRAEAIELAVDVLLR